MRVFDFSHAITDCLWGGTEPAKRGSFVSLLQGLAVAFNVVLIATVIEAVRREVLNVRYAILWLGAGTVLLILSLFRPVLDWAALGLGIAYPPSLLFLVAFVFLLLIVLHYSLVISSHRDSIRRLGQAVARLERKLEDVENRSDQHAGSRSCRTSRPSGS